MYKVQVEKTTFDIGVAGEAFTVDGKEVKWDFSTIRDGYFHVLLNNRSYTAELVKSDAASKTFVINVNGRHYQVGVKDQFDQLLEKMGMTTGSGAKVNSIKAPMPGLIIDLKVTDGQAVRAGEPLLILEAMKMENIIKSPREATVKSVRVKKGDSVEKNQVLIEF